MEYQRLKPQEQKRDKTIQPSKIIQPYHCFVDPGRGWALSTLKKPVDHILQLYSRSTTNKNELAQGGGEPLLAVDRANPASLRGRADNG
jgi:hypothetical protein